MLLLYENLRSMAARMIVGGPSGQTFQATALVHEAFLRLTRGHCQSWENRAHFCGAVAEAMRRILIEDARRRMTQRRGAGQQLLDLEEVEVAVQADPYLLLTMNEALKKLAVLDEMKARVVRLRFYEGLSMKEVGQALGLAERTVKWHWSYARAWLYQEINR